MSLAAILEQFHFALFVLYLSLTLGLMQLLQVLKLDSKMLGVYLDRNSIQQKFLFFHYGSSHFFSLKSRTYIPQINSFF